MADLMTAIKSAVLDHLLDFTDSSLVKSRKVVRFMMNLRTLGLITVLLLLLVPVESYSYFGRCIAAFYSFEIMVY